MLDSPYFTPPHQKNFSMKKITILLLAVLFSATAFAQEFSAGIRVGSGVQAMGVYHYKANSSVEARFGASWNNIDFTYGVQEPSRLMADFTILHGWRLLDMDWTPDVGKWFVDVGAGVNVGGRGHYVYAGVTGMARIGLTFFDAPFTVAFDWSPTFGPNIIYTKHFTDLGFNDLGIANICVSCIYNF